LTDVIGRAIIEKDPANSELYTNNMTSYINSLDALDAEYADAVSSGDKDVILFGDRFPFRYLTDDYGLNYYAAFVGCSAETEASFETITFLAQKVDECGLSVVLTIEKSDKKIAETIIENTSSADQTVMTLDSMQSVTSEDVKNGASYLSIMEENLNVLKEALK
ncbi:MAG: metal ABC transporter substrate-binding protein, partial [Lachnospiraceae bacterium]|nr:metal ABC transporter substrate-binding protein [Lachnospiraceae bacterium]